MVPLVEIYCFIDDFCKYFELVEKQKCLPNPNRKRHRPCRLSLSEIMTIIVLFLGAKKNWPTSAKNYWPIKCACTGRLLLLSTSNLMFTIRYRILSSLRRGDRRRSRGRRVEGRREFVAQIVPLTGCQSILIATMVLFYLPERHGQGAGQTLF